MDMHRLLTTITTKRIRYCLLHEQIDEKNDRRSIKNSLNQVEPSRSLFYTKQGFYLLLYVLLMYKLYLLSCSSGKIAAFKVHILNYYQGCHTSGLLMLFIFITATMVLYNRKRRRIVKGRWLCVCIYII